MESTINQEFIPAEKCEESNFSLVEHEEGQIDTKEDMELAQSTFDSAMEEDFETVRNNLHAMVRQGDGVVKSMISLARASDHPRAFEVVATLMKTLADLNNDILNLHDKKQKIKANKPEKTGDTTNVQNNTVFVGSPTELLKVLAKENQ